MGRPRKHPLYPPGRHCAGCGTELSTRARKWCQRCAGRYGPTSFSHNPERAAQLARERQQRLEAAAAELRALRAQVAAGELPAA